jgi:hypothetical protein
VKAPGPISIISMVKERNYTDKFHVAITYLPVLNTRSTGGRRERDIYIYIYIYIYSKV